MKIPVMTDYFLLQTLLFILFLPIKSEACAICIKEAMYLSFPFTIALVHTFILWATLFLGAKIFTRKITGKTLETLLWIFVAVSISSALFPLIPLFMAGGIIWWGVLYARAMRRINSGKEREGDRLFLITGNIALAYFFFSWALTEYRIRTEGPEFYFNLVGTGDPGMKYIEKLAEARKILPDRLRVFLASENWQAVSNAALSLEVQKAIDALPDIIERLERWQGEDYPPALLKAAATLSFQAGLIKSNPGEEPLFRSRETIIEWWKKEGASLFKNRHSEQK